MRTKVIPAILAALAVVIGVLAAPASAEEPPPPPLGCPEIVEVPGGYQLTADAVCSLVDWDQDGTFLDLGGHTLEGRVFPMGEDQTLRHGTFSPTRDYWATARGFTVSHVTLRGDAATGVIELGSNGVIEHSTIRGFRGYALMDYFGGANTIRDSVFLDNGVALSNQKPSLLTVERTVFVGNGIALNLWPEDGFGSNDHTIRSNAFWANTIGLRLRPYDIGRPGSRFLSGITIEANHFLGNERSGATIDGLCMWGRDQVSRCHPIEGTAFQGNHFWLNGSAGQASGQDDGVTARFTLEPCGPTCADPYPELLEGFTFTDNQAHLNADLGFDVEGVTDGGGNRALLNGDPAQCVGLDCGWRWPWQRRATTARSSAPVDPELAADQRAFEAYTHD